MEDATLTEPTTTPAPENDTIVIKKCKKLPQDELQMISAALQKAEKAKEAATKAVDQAEKADLEAKNTIQRIFLSHMILPQCNIDRETGVITWPEGV